MKTLRILIVTAVLSSLLGGCMLVVDGEGHANPGAHWGYAHGASADVGAKDRALAQMVRSRFDEDSLVHAAAISVHSHDGNVILEGMVNSSETLGRAVDLASSTPGVRSVICELTLIRK